MLVTLVTNGYDVLPAFLANRLSRIDCSDPITRDQRRDGELTVNGGGECRQRKITRH
jgi:hypothetical protein